jgi:hypothetical protein
VSVACGGLARAVDETRHDRSIAGKVIVLRFISVFLSIIDLY